MFEGLMEKLGYTKLTKTETDLIYFVKSAKKDGYDVFIDYLTRTNKQKIYIRNGKKTVYKELLEEL